MDFTQDWFSVNIPNWNLWLARFRGKRCRFMEIGCFEGRSTVWMLEKILTHPEAQIVCIDPFIIDTDASIDTAGAERRFRANTKPWEDKVTLMVRRSEDVLPKFRSTFDFIYIDGSHLSSDVYLDGILSWPLLNPGGLMVFDDYFFDMPIWKGHEWKKTCHGIEKALDAINGYSIIHKSHQVAVLKHK